MNKYIPIIVIVAIIVVALFAIFGYMQNNNSGTPSNNPDQTNPDGTFKGKVEIRGFSYSPATVTIKEGSTLTWQNFDNVGHTITSDSGSELDSQLLGDNDAYSHTFTKKGVYTYHCIPHPNMKGTVIVT